MSKTSMNFYTKKIAVVGGGIFGITIASRLARAGYRVFLFEQSSCLLSSASGINQYRLHRGYHYPRSIETALSAKKSEAAFVAEYPGAICSNHDSIYAIAAQGSKVTADEFEQFCSRCDLEIEGYASDLLTTEMLQGCYKVRESLMDPFILFTTAQQRLSEAGVTVILNKKFTNDLSSEYDHIINATYASLNALIETDATQYQPYQYELCEKIVIKLPTIFNNKSIVILDGPFMCIDPLGKTNFHVMGNVVDAIHHTNIGFKPEIPNEFKDLINRGVITKPSITNFDRFIKNASAFMPRVLEAEHVGSMYTIRTVMPFLDRTDERPTLVYPVTQKLINVFSGKIGNSVQAADDVLHLINNF